MKSVVSILILLLFYQNLLLSQSLVDSLVSQLTTTTSTKQKAAILNELSFQLRYKDAKQSKAYAIEALDIALRNNHPLEEASSLVRLGILAKNTDKYEEARDYYERAFQIRKRQGLKDECASIANNIAILHKNEGNYQAAVDQLLEGLKIADKAKMKAKIQNTLAEVYLLNNEFSKAILEIENSITTRDSLGLYYIAAKSRITLGSIFFQLQNYTQAKMQYSASLQIMKKQQDKQAIAICLNNLGSISKELGATDEAVDYFEEALKLQSWLTGNNTASIKMNLGIINLHKKRFNVSEDYLTESKEYYQQIIDNDELALVIYNLGQLYMEQLNYQKSLQLFQEGLPIALKVEKPKLILQYYYALSHLFDLINQSDSGHYYSRLANTTRDSLYREIIDAKNSKFNIEQIKNKHQLEQKELQNKVLRKQFWNIIIVIISIALGIAGVVFYRSIIKESQRQQSIDNLIHDQENELIYERLRVQELERKRIAQDLHDSVGGMLSTVKLSISQIENKIDKLELKTENQFLKTKDLIDKTVDEVRRVSYNLKSITLEKLGLAAAISTLLDKINSLNSIRVDYQAHGLDQRLMAEIELDIFRIIQELVSNVLKHAKASKLTVNINQFDDVINIMIEDDGIGIKPHHLQEKTGMGLKNIHARIKKLNGSIKFDQKVQRGTLVNIDIPIQKTLPTPVI